MNDNNQKVSKLDRGPLIATKMLKIMGPIHGHTNPLWWFCSPFATLIFKKTPALYKNMMLVELEAKRYGTSKNAIMRDMLYSMMAFGAMPYEYADYKFYGQDNSYRNSFYSAMKNYDIAWTLNDINSQDLFNDKSKQMSYFSDWYHREWVVLSSESDIPECISFLNRYPKCLLKPIDGSEGTGIVLIEKENIEDIEALFHEVLQKGAWILDECIQQHPFMMEIYPHSVNTIRFHTMLGKNGKVRIFYPYLRMGRGGSAVDNYSAGGLAAKVDTETGVIFGKLSGILPTTDDTIHPDTGCRVIGRQIPQWQEIKQMLGEMARACPKTRYLGWDMALSAEHGWTVVEINSPPGITEWRSLENQGLAKEYSDLQRWALEGYHDDVIPKGQIEV